eukprot:16428389-Heterocapsa_arctica.AAC.1
MRKRGQPHRRRKRRKHNEEERAATQAEKDEKKIHFKSMRRQEIENAHVLRQEVVAEATRKAD